MIEKTFLILYNIINNSFDILHLNAYIVFWIYRCYLFINKCSL